MEIFRIPLTPGTPQSLSVTLGVTEYRFVLRYRDALEGGWTLDIIDGATNDELVCGVPLVTGTDLLRQYEYLGITGALAVLTDSDPDAVPTFSGLGGATNLYFVVA